MTNPAPYTARRGRRLPGRQASVALVHHGLRRQGIFSERLKELSGIEISDSALTRRQTRLPWEVFARFMALALQPRPQPRRNHEEFSQGPPVGGHGRDAVVGAQRAAVWELHGNETDAAHP